MGKLQDFRRAKDELFRADAQSPLDEEQRRAFKGLAYFPANPQLVIEAALDPAVDSGTVVMETTGGGEQVYHRAGIVRFKVDGEQAAVTLYASDEQGELFLPFRDATSGKESYPAGRYLETDPPRHGRVTVDFNYAYNPYCAYNERWSCPLPPIENWLKVPIRAGEKDFPGRSGH